MQVIHTLRSVRPVRFISALGRCLRPVAIGVVLAFCAQAGAAQEAVSHPDPGDGIGVVDVASWWVSPGEKASLDVIRRHAEAQGLHWQQRVAPGSGTSRYGSLLEQWVSSGQAPTASQIIGYDIHYWASQGQLAYLDDIAREQEWDAVVPLGIQHLSKYQGHWVAAPINAHSTNWLWVNAALLRQLGRGAPDSWPDLLQLLEQARSAGMVPLAIGPDAWEQTLLFEAVAAGAGGAEFYRRAFLQLQASALEDEGLLRTIFARMRQLRSYASALERTPSWDAGTDQVRQGQALLQVQGTWVNGEFATHQLQPGRDYECFRFPDTQGMFLFNADQYMFFKDAQHRHMRRVFASVLLDLEMQTELNIATGAVPARVDVDRQRFNRCGQQAVSDLRRANLQRTMMGSIAMGNANPPAVKNAIYQVVQAHFMGQLSDADAAQQLRAAILDHRPTPAALAQER